MMQVAPASLSSDQVCICVCKCFVLLKNSTINLKKKNNNNIELTNNIITAGTQILISVRPARSPLVL